MTVVYALMMTVGLLTYGSHADVTFDITNAYSDTIWVGTLGNANQVTPNGGGFVLNPGDTVTVTTPDTWSGRFWPRTGCDPNSNHCETGDCGNKLECQGATGVPPATLVEIRLKGDQGKDFYDVSLVDGFNVGASIEPIDGTATGDPRSCQKPQCTADINGNCPAELKVDGGCDSACVKFNTDQYCCRGQYGSTETCKPDEWPTNYANFFKTQCPDAYSYAFDDPKSILTCEASHYKIQFG